MSLTSWKIFANMMNSSIFNFNYAKIKMTEVYMENVTLCQWSDKTGGLTQKVL